jgi:hypothetical protein
MSSKQVNSSYSEDDESYDNTNNGYIQTYGPVNTNETTNQVDSNGISYESYKILKYSNKQLLGQCQYCLKFYNKGTYDKSSITYKGGMLTTEYDSNGESICYHCIFMINYNKENPELRQNFDGTFGKTIMEYIIECKDSHNVDTCLHSDECFVCDFIRGQMINGIFGSDELFAMSNPQDVNPDNNNLDDEYNFNICI